MSGEQFLEWLEKGETIFQCKEKFTIKEGEISGHEIKWKSHCSVDSK